MQLNHCNLLKNNFKCFICQCGIIDTKKNIGDATVLLRRGKSNNYWGEKTKIKEKGVKNNLFDEYIEDVRESKKYKEAKNQIDNKIKFIKLQEKVDDNLKGIEKSAYPSFMDPKSHPNSSCMICCNANQSKISKKDSTTRKVIKNFDKCLKHYVKYYGNSEDEILDSNKLKERSSCSNKSEETKH